MGVLNELKNCRVEVILITCIGGLSGFHEAVRSVYLDTSVELCVVHIIRNSTKFVSYKAPKKVCADLKQIYSTATEESRRETLEEFGENWNEKYPMISKSWETHWDYLSEVLQVSARNQPCDLHD